MQAIEVTSELQLNQIFETNQAWANGKNFQIDHLHSTIAQSRWDYENIQGIYLTNEQHAWMALWMAISNRQSLQKRHLRYFRPSADHDALGRLEVFSQTTVEQVVGQAGYVYLFDPAPYLAAGRLIDVRALPPTEKATALLAQDFSWQAVVHKGQRKQALVDQTDEPAVVLVDDWQVALTNTPVILPETELHITQPAITQLLGRVALSQLPVGQDYLQ